MIEKHVQINSFTLECWSPIAMANGKQHILAEVLDQRMVELQIHPYKHRRLP